MSIAATLEDIISNLKGNIKTRQQDAVKQLLSLLSDSSSGLIPYLNSKTKFGQQITEKNSGEENDGWNYLIIHFLEYFVQAVENSKDKKSNYDSLTLNPALEALKQISYHFRIQEVPMMLHVATVDAFYTMIAQTAELAHSKLFLPKIRESYQNLLLKVDIQCQLASQATFLGAVFALLQTLVESPQKRGGFQKLTELLRVIILSNGFASMKRKRPKRESRLWKQFQDLFCTATIQTLEFSHIDPQCARDMVLILNFLLKTVLYHDIEALAKPVAQALNEILSSRLADPKANESLCHSIVSCFRIQMRIFINIDGTFDDFPLFATVANAIHNAFLRNFSAQKAKNSFSSSNQDRLIRMDSACIKFYDLVVATMLRLRERHESWESISRADSEDVPAAKRRKMNSGGNVISSFVESFLAEKDTEICPWMRCLLLLLENYPKALPSMDVLKLAENIRDRFSKSYNTELEVLASFCISSLVIVHSATGSASSLVEQSIETLITKLVKAKPGGHVAESCLRALISIFGSPHTSATLSHTAQESIVPHFAILWKSNLFAQPSFSLCAALSAKLGSEFSRVCGPPEDAALYADWALKSLSFFVSQTSSGEETTYGVPFLCAFVGALAGIHSIIDDPQLPGFTSFSTEDDQKEAKDLSTIEKSRSLGFPQTLQQELQLRPATMSRLGEPSPSILVINHVTKLVSEFFASNYNTMSSDAKTSALCRQKLALVAFCVSSTFSSDDCSSNGIQSSVDLIATLANSTAPDALIPLEIRLLRLCLRSRQSHNHQLRDSLKKYICSRLTRHGDWLVAGTLASQLQSKVERPIKRDSFSKGQDASMDHGDADVMDLDDSFNLEEKKLEKRESLSGESPGSESGEAENALLLVEICLTLMQSADTIGAAQKLLKQLIPTVSHGSAFSLLEHISTTSASSNQILDLSSRLLQDLAEREKLSSSLLLSGTQLRQRLLVCLTSHISKYQDLDTTKEPNFKTLVNFAVRMALAFLSLMPYVADSDETCHFVDLLEQMILHCVDEDKSQTFMTAMLELQQTPDFAVRQRVALRLPCLFRIIEEASGPYRIVKGNLPSQEASFPEECGTAILLLCNSMQHSPSLENDIIIDIFKTYGVPQYWPIIRIALGNLASSLQSETLLHFLCPHLCSIFRSIKSITKFPDSSIFLSNVATGILLSDAPSLFRRAPAQIVLFCAFEGDKELLLEMCRNRNVSTTDVVVETYCRCLETVLPAIAQGDKAASKALLFLEQLAPKENLLSRLASSLGSLAGRLLVEAPESGLHHSVQEFFATRLRFKAPSVVHEIVERKQMHSMLLNIVQLASRRPQGPERALSFMMKFATTNSLLSNLSVMHPLIFGAIRLNCYELLSNLLHSSAKNGPGTVALVQSVFDLIVSHLLETNDAKGMKIVGFLCSHNLLCESLENCAILPTNLDVSLNDLVAKQQALLSNQLKSSPLETLLRALAAAKQWHLPVAVRVQSLRLVADGLAQAKDIPEATLRNILTHIISLIKSSTKIELTSMAAECLTQIGVTLLPQLFDVALCEDNELISIDIDQSKFRINDLTAVIKIVRELLVLIHSRDALLAESASKSLVAVLAASKDMIDGPIKANVDDRLLEFVLEHVAAEPVDLDYRPPSNDIFEWRDSSSTGSWIRRVTSELLRASDNSVFNACADVALLCLPFCDLVFPYAFMEVARCHPVDLASAVARSILAEEQKRFPPDVSTLLTRAFVAAHRNCQALVVERRCSLEIEFRRSVQSLRAQPGQPLLAQLKSPLQESCFIWAADPFWKGLNLLQVSKACLAGGSPLAALEFYELHAERVNNQVNPDSELLVDIYASINDPDNSRSLSSVPGVNVEWRIQTLLYTQEAKWQNAIMLFNDQLASTESLDQRAQLHLQITNALLNDGQTEVAEKYLSGLSVSDPHISKHPAVTDLRAQLAWRLKRWDALPSGRAPTGQHLNVSILKLLPLLQGKDQSQYDRVLDSLKTGIFQSLQHLKLDSSENIIRAIVGLHQLNSFSLVSKSAHNPESVKYLHFTWLGQLRDLSRWPHSLEGVEPLLATNQALMQEMLLGSPPINLIKFTRAKAALFRESARYQLASASLRDMNIFMGQLEKVSRQTYLFHILPCRLQEAHVAWSRGERARAVQLIKNLLHFTETDNEFLKLRQKLTQQNHEKHAEELNEALAMAHSAMGDWLSQTQIEGSAKVESHLEKAVSFFSLTKDSARGHFELATFLDSRLAAMQEADRSIEAATERQVREARKEAALAAERLGPKDHTFNKLLQRVASDEEQAKAERERKSQLIANLFQEWLAVLCKSGEESKKHILHAVFRVISVWTSTSSERADLSKIFKAAIDQSLLANRFLPLFYQIASRISNQPAGQSRGTSPEAAFQDVLTHLIEKIATSNPHQSLPTLFALTRSDVVMTVHAKQYNHDVVKMQAAKTLWNSLRGIKGFRETVDQSERLLDAYVELAFLDPSKCKADPQRPSRRYLASQLKITKLKDLTDAGVPTYNGSSEIVPNVFEILPYFDLVGGITAPKAIYCRGNDGNWYKQLVKGPAHSATSAIPDDLRQDAVMQQAFTLINSLLSLDSAARSRALRMRSYRVVPLTPAAGVLEWVTGTSPILDYLVGSAIKVGDTVVLETGAHHRFHPKDKLHAAIRNDFAIIRDASPAVRQNLFQKTCQNFHPVFHNFFIEKFPSPMDWYLKRLAYTRSVATSSMVGYIIGLGDRHSSNILIDNQTAELVHIDLGVAFEQGKQLPIPELVPFRLTRDLVHGMGVAGTDGVFSESCERTMSVMRQQRQFIENIVEVFLHDPLFKWAVAPGRAQRLQRDDSFEGQDGIKAQNMPKATLDATSTILRVKQKLRGTDYGDALSVEGQVRKLIQDAVNPELLSKMYYGWAPWL